MPGKITRVIGSPDIRKPLAQLDVRRRNWDMVLFQPDRPVVEGELNAAQQIQSEKLRRLATAVFGAPYAVVPGPFFDDSREEYGEQTFYPIDPTTRDGGDIPPLNRVGGAGGTPYRLWVTPGTRFVVNGEVLTIENMTSIIDNMAMGSPELNSWAGGYRLDIGPMPDGYTNGDPLVALLEMWYEEVQPEESLGTANDEVRAGGWTDGEDLGNDLHVDEVPLRETSRRVQVRAQIRWVAGFDATGWYGKGVPEYPYGVEGLAHDLPDDTIAFEPYVLTPAGDGSPEAAEALGSVDGYVYALPLLFHKYVQDGGYTYNHISVPFLTPNLSDLAAKYRDLRTQYLNLERRMLNTFIVPLELTDSVSVDASNAHRLRRIAVPYGENGIRVYGGMGSYTGTAPLPIPNLLLRARAIKPADGSVVATGTGVALGSLDDDGTETLLLNLNDSVVGTPEPYYWIDLELISDSSSIAINSFFATVRIMTVRSPYTEHDVIAPSSAIGDSRRRLPTQWVTRMG